MKNKKSKSIFRSKHDAEEFMLWVDFLKAGVFEKGKKFLLNDDTYCCLGVGCALFVPEEKFWAWQNLFFPPGCAPKWLYQIDKDFKEKTDARLSKLNDVFDISHPEIAERLLKTYGPKIKKLLR